MFLANILHCVISVVDLMLACMFTSVYVEITDNLFLTLSCLTICCTVVYVLCDVLLACTESLTIIVSGL